jgi:hypothetical protein
MELAVIMHLCEKHVHARFIKPEYLLCVLIIGFNIVHAWTANLMFYIDIRDVLTDFFGGHQFT